MAQGGTDSGALPIAPTHSPSSTSVYALWRVVGGGGGGSAPPPRVGWAGGDASPAAATARLSPPPRPPRRPPRAAVRGAYPRSSRRAAPAKPAAPPPRSALPPDTCTPAAPKTDPHAVAREARRRRSLGGRGIRGSPAAAGAATSGGSPAPPPLRGCLVSPRVSPARRAGGLRRQWVATPSGRPAAGRRLFSSLSRPLHWVAGRGGPPPRARRFPISGGPRPPPSRRLRVGRRSARRAGGRSRPSPPPFPPPAPGRTPHQCGTPHGRGGGWGGCGCPAVSPPWRHTARLTRPRTGRLPARPPIDGARRRGSCSEPFGSVPLGSTPSSCLSPSTEWHTVSAAAVHAHPPSSGWSTG